MLAWLAGRDSAIRSNGLFLALSLLLHFFFLEPIKSWELISLWDLKPGYWFKHSRSFTLPTDGGRLPFSSGSHSVPVLWFSSQQVPDARMWRRRTFSQLRRRRSVPGPRPDRFFFFTFFFFFLPQSKLTFGWGSNKPRSQRECHCVNGTLLSYPEIWGFFRVKPHFVSNIGTCDEIFDALQRAMIQFHLIGLKIGNVDESRDTKYFVSVDIDCNFFCLTLQNKNPEEIS